MRIPVQSIYIYIYFGSSWNFNFFVTIKAVREGHFLHQFSWNEVNDRRQTKGLFYAFSQVYQLVRIVSAQNTKQIFICRIIGLRRVSNFFERFDIPWEKYWHAFFLNWT